MGVESYLHRYAKITLAGWFRKRIRIGEMYKGLNNIDLVLDWEWCQTKTPKGTCGVYMEYPVCKDIKTKKIIGLTEGSWGRWLKKNELSVSSKTDIPTLYELNEWSKSKSKSKPYLDFEAYLITR